MGRMCVPIARYAGSWIDRAASVRPERRAATRSKDERRAAGSPLIPRIAACDPFLERINVRASAALRRFVRADPRTTTGPLVLGLTSPSLILPPARAFG